MILYLYKLIWRILYPLLGFISRLNLPKRWMAGERLSSGPGTNKKTIWFHCASLGEAKGLWGLISHSHFPDLQLIITASTKTGADYLSSACSGLSSLGSPIVRIAPADHSGLVKQFLIENKVELLCLYEGELWPNYIDECRVSGKPVFLICARIGKRSRAVFKVFRKSIRRLMNNITFVQAIDREQAMVLSGLTGKRTTAGVDYKFLNYFPSGHRHHKTSKQKNGLAFVSIHTRELKKLLPVIPDLMKLAPILIFPRYMSELSYFNTKLEKLGFKKSSEHPGSTHLLVDGYGQIPKFLKRCRHAFIGGTLVQVGGHNLWELLAEVDSIITGPYFHNQSTLTQKLIKSGIAKVISEPRDIPALLRQRIKPLEIDAFLKETSQKVDKSRSELIRKLRSVGINML